MHRFNRSSFALVGLGLTLAAPAASVAQDAPAGYRPAQAAPVVGPDGKPMTVMAAPAPAAAPHKHLGRILCAKCAAKARKSEMPEGQIVACAHSKNGVCTACAALLAMPGPVTIGTPGPAVAASPSSAPGRAVVASSGAPAARSASGVQVAYDGSGMAEPAPIGVMQANYAQPMPGGMAPAGAPMMAPGQPGRAVVDVGPGQDPIQKKSGAFPHPHIIGHLFGFAGSARRPARPATRRRRRPTP